MNGLPQFIDFLDPAVGIETTGHIACFKLADFVLVSYSSFDNTTEFSYRSVSPGVRVDQCRFSLSGNLYSLNDGQSKTFEIQSGGSSQASALRAAAASAIITEFTYEHEKAGVFRPIYKASGIAPVSPEEFISILTDLDRSYERFVALLDGDTMVVATDQIDRLEVGAGDDTVVAKGGDDVVWKWSAGDLDYKGGAGKDVLYFETQWGFTPFPNAVVQQMVVDLKAGTGQNPYGGNLTLSSVEVIHDTDHADRVIGGRAAETVISDRGSDGDVFKLGGAKDTFFLSVSMKNAVIDGGAGNDELWLAFISDSGPNRLDLADATQNSGIFAGAKVVNVESFHFTLDWPTASIVFVGGVDDDTVTLHNDSFAQQASGTFLMGGGRDSVIGGTGGDVIKGGAGADTLKGQGGDDRIFGGALGDFIEGGAGNDRLGGGSGKDRFVFSDGFDRDRILDFENGIDKFDFSGHAGIDAFRDLKVRDTVLGVKILDGEGGRIDIVGIEKAEIDNSDFLF